MDAYWTYNSDDALAALATSASGLSSAEAARRLREHGPNQVHEQRDLTRAAVLLNQLRNPLIWLLLFVVLLERHLDVVRRGVEEGRRTFANSLKYLIATTSANFGNMLSMAVASLLIPFLPLTAGQILLNNLLSDVPAIGLADDNVDAEWVERPGRWDMRLIARFMVEFGLLSSLFDFMTFGVLLRVFRANPALFRTGWFLESLLTELAVALVVRTRRPCFRSRPGALLVKLTAAVAAIALVIPYLPVSSALGFVPLPASLFLAVLGITLSYVLVAELVKARLYGTTATQLIGARP